MLIHVIKWSPNRVHFLGGWTWKNQILLLFAGALPDFPTITLKDKQLDRANFSAWPQHIESGLILGLRTANERRRYFLTTCLIVWVQTCELQVI